VSRTLQRQVRVPQELPPDPRGEQLTTLRAGASTPAKSHPYRSPGVQLPAATTTAATTVRVFHSLRTITIRNGRLVPLICYLVDAQVRWIFIKQLAKKNCEGLATTRDCLLGPVKYFASKSTPCTTRGHALQYWTISRVKNRIKFNFYFLMVAAC
jgi:hypothetical protein